jgi:TnpA family transposase
MLALSQSRTGFRLCSNGEGEVASADGLRFVVPVRTLEIMTDTGAYTDVVFGLFWLLGYRFSPRIADIGGARYWRIDPSADYGRLNGIARHRIYETYLRTLG